MDLVARRFNFDLRPTWRKLAKEEQADWADNIASSAPPVKGDGDPGGSLAHRIGKPTSRKIKRWGYKIRLRNNNHHLRFYHTGTVHQKARPVAPRKDEERISRMIQEETVRQFQAWDRRAK